MLLQQNRLAAARPARLLAARWQRRRRTGLHCAGGAEQHHQRQNAVQQGQQGSATALAVAAGMLGLALCTPAPTIAETLEYIRPEPQQLQALITSSAGSSASMLSAIAPLTPAEAPSLVSNSGDVLLEGFKGIVQEGLHDLTESSMTAVGGPVTGEALSAGGSSTTATSSQTSDLSAGGQEAMAASIAAAPATDPTGAPTASAAVEALPSPTVRTARLGLLCGMWQAYCNALETSPLLTKVYTGVVGTLLGDLAAQLLSYQQQLSGWAAARRSSSDGGSGRESRRGSSSGGSSPAVPGFQFDALRCARLCLYSAVIGTPMGHYWYMGLEHHVMPVTPTAPAAVAAKVCLDQLLQTPFGMALFLGGMKLLEGRPGEVKSELRGKMVPALLANWKLWPAAQLINFMLIPEQQRILYGNIVGICWTCIISNMQQASTMAAAAPHPGAATATSAGGGPAGAVSAVAASTAITEAPVVVRSRSRAALSA